MDREPLEHAEGNGLAFGNINDADDDIEAGSPLDSSATTTPSFPDRIRSLLCPGLTTSAESHELESLVPGDGSSLGEERRPSKHNKLKKYIKSGVCIVLVSLVIYTSIALAILYTAGNKIDVGYNGGLKLELTCDGEQRITAEIEFANVQSLDLVVSGPELKFNDWGVLVPSSSIVIENGVLKVTGTMTVPNEESLSNFLTHYIGWRLNNTHSQPNIDVGISGKLSTSLFPFKIPFSVSNSVAAPQTNTTFLPQSLNVLQNKSSVEVLFNCSSEGLHAWHHAFNLGFVSEDLGVTATTGFYNQTDQQTLLVESLPNATGSGLANAINVLINNKTQNDNTTNTTSLHIRGVPGPCLANRVMSKVDIEVRYAFIQSALSRINTTQSEQDGLKVSLVRATLDNSRQTGIDLNTELEVENLMPITIVGLDATNFSTSDGSISRMSATRELMNSGGGFSIDFDADKFSDNIADPVFNSLSLPPIEGGICLQADTTTWLGTFINSLDESFRCLTNFTKTSTGPGYGLWQALLQPHWYISQMSMLPLTDRHVDAVGSEFVHLKTVQMLLPVSTVQIYPLTTLTGIPNIEITGPKKVTATSSGAAFNSHTRCWMDDNNMLHIDVNFTEAVGFGDLLTGGGSTSQATVAVADWEISVPLRTPSWDGLFSVVDMDDGQQQVVARNRFPVDLFLKGGQQFSYGGEQFGQLPSEGVSVPMHSITADGPHNTQVTPVVVFNTSTAITSPPTTVTVACRRYHTKEDDSPTLCPGDDPTDPDNLCQQEGIDQICLFGQSDVCSDDAPDNVLIYDVCPQQCVWCSLSDGSAPLEFVLP